MRLVAHACRVELSRSMRRLCLARPLMHACTRARTLHTCADTCRHLHSHTHRCTRMQKLVCFLWYNQAMDAKLERRKNYCALAVALLEDLPMGAPQRRCPQPLHAQRFDLGFSASTKRPLVSSCRRVERSVSRECDRRVRRFQVPVERTEHMHQHQPRLPL